MQMNGRSSRVHSGVSGDKVCNVYDMAYNYQEFTTEYNVRSNGNCWDTFRGNTSSQGGGTSTRKSANFSTGSVSVSFRIILYLK